jgi:hypothetical protein
MLKLMRHVISHKIQIPIPKPKKPSYEATKDKDYVETIYLNSEPSKGSGSSSQPLESPSESEIIFIQIQTIHELLVTYSHSKATSLFMYEAICLIVCYTYV